MTKNNKKFPAALPVAATSTDMKPEHKQPSAPDIERLITGALMGDDCALAEKMFRDSNFLRPEYFFTAEDRHIFTAIGELVADGKPHDDLMLAQKLRRMSADGRTTHENLLEQIGGVAALEKRKNEAKRKKDYSIEHYARIIYRLHTQREAAEILAKQINRVLSAREDDIFDIRNEIADSLRTTSDTSYLKAQEANRDIEEAGEEAPMRMLMGSLITENTISFLFASPGKGKTILGVQIAEAIARGESMFRFTTDFGTDFLLKNECTQGMKIGYCDLELSNHQFKKRFTNPITGATFKLSDNFIRISTNRKGRRKSADKENTIFRDIENAVAMHKIQFLVIDNISKLSPDAKSDGEVMARIMDRFEYLRDKYNLTLLILAHTPKRINMTQPMTFYDMAGSAIAADFADSIFCIGEDATDPHLKYIKQVKDREGEGTYTIDNVIRCTIQPIDQTFLSFSYMNCGSERDHLEQFMSRETIDALVEAAILKKAENPMMGWRTVAKEINWNMSENTLKSKMIAFAQNSQQYEFDKVTTIFYKKTSSVSVT